MRALHLASPGLRLALNVGLISAALSCQVYPPCEERGRSACSFPEQRLVIKPTLNGGNDNTIQLKSL